MGCPVLGAAQNSCFSALHNHRRNASIALGVDALCRHLFDLQNCAGRLLLYRPVNRLPFAEQQPKADSFCNGYSRLAASLNGPSQLHCVVSGETELKT